MAKDALGHGSETRGGSLGATYPNINRPIVAAHQTGIEKATAPMQRRQFEAIAGAIYEANMPGLARGELAQHFANALHGDQTRTSTPQNSVKLRQPAIWAARKTRSRV